MIPKKRMSYVDKEGTKIIIEGSPKFVDEMMRRCKHEA